MQQFSSCFLFSKRVSIPMTVLGGLQCVYAINQALKHLSFNTDDGIRRAAIHYETL